MNTPSPNLTDLFAQLATLPETGNEAFFSFLVQLGETLLTPLNTIISILPSLQQNHLTPELQQEYGNIVYQNSIQILQILGNLMHQAEEALGKKKNELATPFLSFDSGDENLY